MRYSTDRFTWLCREVDSLLHFRFEGELDYVAVRVNSAALVAALGGQRRMVILDLSGISFMDSSGLGLLIRMKQRVEGQNGTLKVSKVSSPARRLIDLTRLNAWFDPADVGRANLRLCPVCDGAIAQQARKCDRCGSAL